MQIHSKIALLLLAAAISLPAAFAQDSDTATSPDQMAAPAQMDGNVTVRTRGQWSGGKAMWVGRGSDDGCGPRVLIRRRVTGMPGGGMWMRGGRGMGIHHGGMDMGMHGRAGRDLMLARLVDNPTMRERLGITADQATKIRQETSDFEKSEIRNRADAQLKMVDLRDLLAATTPDRAAIDKEIDDIAASRVAEAKAAIHFRLDMRDALTSEQRQKLQQMREGFGHDGMRGGPNAGPHPMHGRQNGPGGQTPAPPPGPQGAN